MDFNSIMIAAGTIGGMGFVFGGVLAIFNRVFEVREDPMLVAVRAALPGANCGGCGFAGCEAFAQALIDGKAQMEMCGVMNADGLKAVAAIIGADVAPKDKKVAVVRCMGSLDKCAVRFEYSGIKTCQAADLAAHGDKACQYACLGYGDCIVSCKFDALKMVDGRLVEVDADNCVGCGACVTACPRSVIQLIPERHAVLRTCSAMKRGKVVRDNCTAGCIGCGKCARMCKFGAITMVNDLPAIDHSKCVGCMQCADGCPTGALMPNEALRRRAVIHYPECIGCGKCSKVCQFGAVAGAPRERHSIIEWNCVGCGACEGVCPHGCIEMLPGSAYGNRQAYVRG
ncbi:MAG: 4Fe-4S dicluster domain-containing protein [Christensenellales bacterium]|jgi:electron transport complex protein RnfB